MTRVHKPTIRATLLIALVALLAAACTSSGGAPRHTVTRTVDDTPTSSTTSAASTSPSTPKSTAPPASPVHIKLFIQDGATFGVGMPVIAFFSKKITSAKALQAATTVTVNGTPMKGAWYFEYSSFYKGYPIEGHFRLQNYWPAHSHVHVNIPAKGLSAGPGLAYDDSLTSDFYIGASHIATVSDITHKITIVSDGKKWGTFPVSLGSHKTPTTNGIKVIMEKGIDISMRGPGYYDPHVKYTQRLTYGGEYLHSAPWNIYNIKHGIDSSNGCTNLLPDDAVTLYHFLRVGDVVKYPNADGPHMQLGQGYGDWNLTWGAWQSGGLVPTT